MEIKLSEDDSDLKSALFSCVMELTLDERKELLDMWKGRKINET